MKKTNVENKSIGLIDKTTIELESYLSKHLEEIIIEVFEDKIKNKKQIKLPFGNINFLTNYHESKIEVDKMVEKIGRICKGKDFLQFLALFRKLPFFIYFSIKKLFERRVDPKILVNTFEQATFFGTNAILNYSNNQMNLESIKLRYNFTPSSQDLRDAIKVMIFSIFTRHDQFYMNSMARLSCVNRVVAGQLMDIYNERLHKSKTKLSNVKDEGDSIILPAFFPEPLNSPKRSIVLENDNANRFELWIRNYFPGMKHSGYFLEKFQFLSNKDFEKKMGLSFEKWWKIWITINRILKQNLWIFLPITSVKSLNLVRLSALADKFDDYSDNCLGGGEISSFLNVCHQFAKQKYKHSPPSLKDCETFFNKLCFDAIHFDNSFIEQPFLFYKVGPNHFFWDYLRHGNLLNGISRKVKRTESGKKFEDLVKKKLFIGVKGIEKIESNFIIKNKERKKNWEIDLMMMRDNIVFIIETKHNFKSIGYHLGNDGAVSDRIQKKESELKKQDENLKKYQQQIYNYWKESSPIGAICILCTFEVEFISSFEMKYWLLNGKIPRICTLDELLNFFQKADLEQLLSHPNLIKFG